MKMERRPRTAADGDSLWLAELVETARGITYFIGHFEIEQLFEEGCSFCIWEYVGELGEAHVATVADDVEYLATERGDVVLFEIESLLDGCGFVGRLPIHGIEEILCRGDEPCAVETNEAVTAVAAVVGDTAGESEDVASIVEGN